MENKRGVRVNFKSAYAVPFSGHKSLLLFKSYQGCITPKDLFTLNVRLCRLDVLTYIAEPLIYLICTTDAILHPSNTIIQIGKFTCTSICCNTSFYRCGYLMNIYQTASQTISPYRATLIWHKSVINLYFSCNYLPQIYPVRYLAC